MIFVSRNVLMIFASRNVFMIESTIHVGNFFSPFWPFTHKDSILFHFACPLMLNFLFFSLQTQGRRKGGLITLIH